jgi:hypothetical protein
VRCAYCQTEFTPKHRDRQKCPRRCRLAAWQAGRHQAREGALTAVEEDLTRALTRLLRLRRPGESR